MQEIIVGIVGIIVLAVVIYKVYKFFTESPAERGCGCSHCECGASKKQK